MKVLIAGATGAIGVPLVDLLLTAGHQVTGLVRTSTGGARLRHLGAEALTADVLDRDALLRAVEPYGFDAVVHELTALKKAPSRFSDMDATNELRTRGTTTLLEAARAVGARRFLTQSIVFGYGFGDSGAEPLSESSPFGRRRGDRFDPIIAALASAEDQAFAEPMVEAISLRYGLFYGRDLPTIERLLRRRGLPVTSWTGTLALIHHDDAAAATVAALESGRVDTAYNIVDDTPVSWRGYVLAAAEATGAPRPWTIPAGLLRAAAPYFGRIATQTNLVVSNARAREELDWQPRYRSCVEGLHAAVSARPPAS